MNKIGSYTDYEALLNTVNASYGINGEKISLHRDMIGRVYFIEGLRGKAVLKLYRGMDTGKALQTTGILEYLREAEYPAVRIVRTAAGEPNISIQGPEGVEVGILFDYVNGWTPDINSDITNIGLQVARLHRIMDEYPGRLVNNTRDHYIDDYLLVMKEADYSPARIADLERYGDELWEAIRHLPRSFCHGDMHTGNMLKIETGEYVMFDFDEASGDYPLVDVAYMSDATDFNHFNHTSYEATIHRFERFYQGYSEKSALSEAEIVAVPDIIAIRHYTILGRIFRRHGWKGTPKAFFDEQYEWLMEWRNLCERKKKLKVMGGLPVRRTHWSRNLK